MAWQLIFTSAPRTLTAGQSGYGTVARSADLREALVQRLEQLSYFEHWTPSAAETPPVICAYRILDLRGAKFHVLTRIQDAGLDFTHRTNHLAHHLVFGPEELARLPSPAVILRYWHGWRGAWQEEPRWLTPGDSASLAQLPRAMALPAQTWQKVTGDAGSAAALLERTVAGGCYLICDATGQQLLLELFAESLELLDPEGQVPAQKWQLPFTTCLQTADYLGEFRWRAIIDGSPASLQTQSNSSAPWLPLSGMRAPANALATLARRGPAPPEPPPAPPTPSQVLPRQPLRLQTAPAAKPPIARVGGYRASDAGLPALPAALTARTREPTRGPWPAWCASPRFVVPAICVSLFLAALFAGFVWPGWFGGSAPKPEQPPGVKPQPKPPQTLAQAGKTNDPVPAQASNAVAPAPPPPKIERPSPAALEHLKRQVDQTPTYVMIAGAGANLDLELPRIPELEELVGRLLPNDMSVPLPLDAVEVWMSSGAVCLTLPKPAAPLSASKDETEKTLEFKGAQLEYRISFKDWRVTPAKPMLLSRFAPRPEPTALLVQPGPAGLPVKPFRLLICDPGAPPAPLALAKAFVRLNQTNLEQSLDPAVMAKLRALHPPTNHYLQLRPMIGPERDLHDELLKEAALDPPPAGQELNFNLARAGLEVRIKRAQDEHGKLEAKARALKEALDRADAEDVELDKRMAIADGHFASLKSYVEAEKAVWGHETFRRYLQALCKGRLTPEELARLSVRQPAREALEHLPELLAQTGRQGFPSAYFVERWASLGKMQDLANRRSDLRQAKANLDHLKAAQAKIPASLAGVREIRLYVVAPSHRRLVELVRFTDAPPASP